MNTLIFKSFRKKGLVNTFSILFFLFIFKFSGFSQEFKCGFGNIDNTPISNFFFPPNSGRCDDECNNSCEFDRPIYIPVAFHIIPDPLESTLYPSENLVELYLDNANQILGEENIILVRADDYYPCVNFYNSPDQEHLNIDPFPGGNEAEIFLSSRYDPQKVLNIYYVRYIIDHESGIIGYSRTPENSSWNWENDGIVISKALHVSGKDIAHELGHYLSLLHIWGLDFYPETNCHGPEHNCTRGDLVPDTEPCRRPYPWPHDNTCDVLPSWWPVFQSDPTTNPFCSSEMVYECNNFMGYSGDQNEVSDGQVNRMIRSYYTSRPEMIPESFTANVELLSSSSVRIHWNRSVNTSGYEIKYKKVSDPDFTIVTINDENTLEYILNDLLSGIDYEIQIRPLCTGEFISLTFKTVCPLTNLCDPCNLPQNIEVSQSGIFSQPQVNGNLIIKNNSTVTINSRIEFSQNSGIIVEYGSKLILDEATLTKCSEASSWRGIKVSADYGYIWGFTNQPSTEVIVRNSSIIEHAETGINAIDQVTIFSTSNVGGAKISMSSNSVIRNCNKGIKFGPIYGIPELSTMNTCQFIDNDFAIYLENNNGLYLFNNTFDLNYFDIESNSSSVYADQNTFNSGVIFHSNFPVFQGSTFINNEFYAFQPEHGITIDAHSNASDFFIQNNQFFGTGIITLGELDFDIAQNDFHDAKEGTWINDSGDNTDNFVRENSFFDNTYGNSASGINDTEYLKNCFENIDTLSIEVNELSSIHENQGIAEDAAGNCFSFSGRVGTGMTSEFFEYFVLENTLTQSCKKPGSGGNFSEESSNQELSSICGTGTNIYGSFPPLFRNCMYANGMTLEQLIAAIRAEIQTVEANTNLDPWTKKWLLAKYRRCLDRYIKQKARALISQNDRQAAISFLSAQSEFRYQSMAYGLITESGDVLGARTKLTTMIPTDTGETEYISAQHILLDYLADRTGYLPSSLTLSGLYNAGLRKHPLAGYSRSVYYTLTGQKVPVTLTHLNGGTQIRSKIESEVKINLYPNPSKGDLLIIDFENLNPDVSYKYSISDIYGKIICQNHILESKTEVPVMTLSEGIYIIKISSDEKLFYVKKWIRIN